MKLKDLFFCFLIGICLLVNSKSSFADCNDAEPSILDNECNTTQCGGTEDEKKGCYLPPVPGSTCPSNYPNKVDICCCNK